MSKVRSEEELRETFEITKKKWIRYHNRILKYKQSEEPKKKSIGMYSMRCVKLISFMNGIRFALREPSVSKDEVNSWPEKN